MNMFTSIFTLPLLLIPALAAGAASSNPSELLDLSRTLRVDCILSGSATEQEISLAELRSIEGWAGRRVNLDDVPLKGNGQLLLEVRDTDGDLVPAYRTSFSTLFQEWQSTEEATLARKSFENVFLLPMPAGSGRLTLTLFDVHGRTAVERSFPIDPSDILIRPATGSVAPHSYLWKGGSSEDRLPDTENLIDVAIVAEGYTADEMDKFLLDAEEAIESLWAHEPFSSMRDRFNFVAVCLPSAESGVSVPREGGWKDTAVKSQFDTFYSDRYLTTLKLFSLHDALAGIPYEHLVILANTKTYGGGGIYNSYTLTTAGHPGFRPVVVHEFGHSFAGLADEYFYDDQFSEYYWPDTEPWEANITTKKDFSSKWEDLVGKEFDLGIKDFDWVGRMVVKGKVEVGLFEGGGYQSKGVWRPIDNCRMRTNSFPAFCPVCQRAIKAMIDFQTVEDEN